MEEISVVYNDIFIITKSIYIVVTLFIARYQSLSVFNHLLDQAFHETSMFAQGSLLQSSQCQCSRLSQQVSSMRSGQLRPARTDQSC